MQYSKLCELYEKLEKESSRLKKTELVSEFLKQLKHEISKNPRSSEIIYLLQGRVWPDYVEKEFGISTQLSIKAIEKASGISNKEIIHKFKKTGDLGLVSEECFKHKKQSTLYSHKLTTEKVLENLKKLPELQGKGTVDKKLSLISELLTSSSSIEAKYIVRTLLNDLRVGLGSGTIRDSIAWSCFDKEREKEENKEEYKEFLNLIQESYDRSTDFAVVFEKACKGRESLKRIELTPGKPLKVMLALKAENIADGFERCKNSEGKLALEFKYDGFRMLLNKSEDNKIKIFTRRLDEVTIQFPEVVDYVKKHIKAKTFIIDSEAVGYDKKTKKYTSFQSISQRIKRKYDIDKLASELPVEINAFDILYLNGKSLIDTPFEERTKILKELIKKEKFKFTTAEQLITDNQKKAQEFYEKALKAGEEGIMFKNLNSPYKPGARVGHMLKLKPSEKELDVVITGAEYGEGKRAGWLSSFDIACYDEDSEKFLEIGKVSTGIKEKSSEEENTITYEELTKLLKPLITKEEGKHVKIKPKMVITIIFQEIQKSPTYESGFALRFPRFTRLRDEKDKPLKEISTLKDVRTDYDRLNEWRRVA
jgi:DNA ligase-1